VERVKIILAQILKKVGENEKVGENHLPPFFFDYNGGVGF